MSTPEQLPQGPENGVETPRVSAEHYERLDSKEIGEHLKNHESVEKQAEDARVEANELALSVEKGGAEKTHNPSTAAPVRRKGVISKKEKDVAYKKHMSQVQAELPALQRTFSRFIHSPLVERTSETLGSTVARPNAILAGSVVAFVLVLAVFLVAQHFGYALSGFETIAAFVAGWIIGLMYDFFKIMITGKK
jgi:hypothetical protein